MPTTDGRRRRSPVNRYFMDGPIRVLGSERIIPTDDRWVSAVSEAQAKWRFARILAKRDDIEVVPTAIDLRGCYPLLTGSLPPDPPQRQLSLKLRFKKPA